MNTLLTVQDCCDVLKLNYRTVLNLIHIGHIKAIKIGKTYRISSKEIERFINSADKKTTYYKVT